jgi:2-polyprenyl-3-methyl-5-hydroxy-6-metoxy-1,4-benzoquinol methylase
MAMGPFIRRMFGPYERQISEAYRAAFFDIDAFVERMRQWTPNATKILEVGCGEGAVTERLNAAYPFAKITAIDITPRLGRLYEGSRDKVRFIRCNVQKIAATEPGQYDLVVLCDVLHHVPVAFRQELLDAIRATLAPGGAFVLKEWERTSTPIHWLCYATDRWVTGDRIHYMTRHEARERLARGFGETALVAEARFAPWRNNIATLVRP